MRAVKAFESRTSIQAAFNSQNFVPLRHSLTSREGANFQLSGVRRDREMRNKCVFGLSRTRGDNRLPSCRLRDSNGFERFCHRPDLIQLDEHGVGDLLLDPGVDAFGICGEQIVSNNLDGVP